MFVCHGFVALFPPLAAKLIGPQTGCQFFKNVDFFLDTNSLNTMAYLRDWWSFLEIVFVGQCEVFVCLGFVALFPTLAAKLIGPQTGCQFFKNFHFFFYTIPLRETSMSRVRLHLCFFYCNDYVVRLCIVAPWRRFRSPDDFRNLLATPLSKDISLVKCHEDPISS